MKDDVSAMGEEGPGWGYVGVPHKCSQRKRKVLLKRVLERGQQLPLSLYGCFGYWNFWVSRVGILLKGSQKRMQ